MHHQPAFPISVVVVVGFLALGAAPSAAQPYGVIDQPGAHVGQAFAITGYAVDLSSVGSTGITAVHIHASGPGLSGFLGAATLNVYRPDLAAAYPQYPCWHHSGFRLDVGPLTPGTYTMQAYAHSGSSSWAPPPTFNIFVPGGPTVVIDTPASTQQPFTLTGAAGDPQSVSGPGVVPTSVHVYAHPTNGGPSTLLGTATYGLSRPEYAGTPFSNSGWSLPVVGLSGQYTFEARALGQVANVWGSGSRVLTVTNQVAWFMAPPFNAPVGTNLVQPFTIRGAVADLASQTGTGISAVQVWAWDPATSAWFAVNPQYTVRSPVK